jgi:hypothetical protein
MVLERFGQSDVAHTEELPAPSETPIQVNLAAENHDKTGDWRATEGDID